MRSLLAQQEPLCSRPDEEGRPSPPAEERLQGTAHGSHHGKAKKTFPTDPRPEETRCWREALGKPTRAAFRAENRRAGPVPVFRGYAPRGAPLGRCRADPPPARLSVCRRGREKGGTAVGEGERPAPARPPSRPGGTRGGSYLWRSWGRLGGGGIPRPVPRLGAPLRASLSGGSAPRGAGAWLMAAAGTMRGGPGGGRRGWPHSPPPRRRAGGKEGRKEGAEDRLWRQPPPPPRRAAAGLATAGQAAPCG